MNHFLGKDGEEEHEVYSRMGQFCVNPKLFRKQPEALFSVMKDILVVRCEYIWPRGEFHYIALSPLFEPLLEGQSAPFYVPEITLIKGETKGLPEGFFKIEFTTKWKRTGQFDRFALE